MNRKPDLPLVPNALQKAMLRTGKELKRQLMTGERYSELGDDTIQPQITPQRPVVSSRYSSINQLPREEVTFTPLRELNDTNATLRVVNRLSDPFGDDAEVTDQLVDTAKPTSSIENLTPTAATEKSTQKPRSVAIPRQTKTSVLRAQLSAGQRDRDEQTKALDSTDQAAPRVSAEPPTNPNQCDGYHTRGDAQARRSSNSLQASTRTTESAASLREKKSAQSLHSIKSTKSHAKGHIIAQVNGGDRRPSLPTRLLSRSSLRNASRALVSAPSSRSSSRKLPTALPVLKSDITSNDNAIPTVEIQLKSRRSSIPVPNHLALNATSVVGRNPLRNSKNIQARATVKDTNCSAFRIYSDTKESQSFCTTKKSPGDSFTLKQISAKSPEYGPSLRISPSAERLIMGLPDTGLSNKAKQPIYEKTTKSFLQKATNGSRNKPTAFITPTSAMNERSERPASSNGVLQSSPRQRLLTSDAHEKRVKSADMSSTVMVNFRSASDPSRTNTGASKVSKASSTNGPYFDAQEKFRNSLIDGLVTPQELEVEQGAIDEAAWISPMKEKTDEALAEVEKTKSVSSTLSNEVVAKKPEVRLEETLPSNFVKELSTDAKDMTRLTDGVPTHISGHRVQATVHTGSKPPSSNGSHPPRSSSRVRRHDYADRTPPHSPLTAERASPAPLKENVRRGVIQNKSGSLYSKPSSHVDFFNSGLRRSSSVHVSTAREFSKPGREHTISKNPFSNIRNMFNKRTSTPDPSKTDADKTKPSKKPTASKNKKTQSQKIIVSSTGSPFPSTGLVPKIYQPVHTPKASATLPRKAPTISTIATPALKSPNPTSISTTTTLAMNLLTAARNEQSSPRKEKLLELSRIMVDAITQARDAEKAAEEAKIAARKAEVAKETCEELVAEVGRLVGETKGVVMGVGKK